jgi:hypothetical protein
MMVSRKTSQTRSRLLLAAALVWFVSVTLCSTKLVVETPHHMVGPAHHHHACNDTCGCESIHAVSAQDFYSSLAKAPAPAGPLFFFFPTDNVFNESHLVALHRQNTDPPERLSFAELVLQHGLLSHAPPRSA